MGVSSDKTPCHNVVYEYLCGNKIREEDKGVALESGNYSREIGRDYRHQLQIHPKNRRKDTSGCAVNHHCKTCQSIEGKTYRVVKIKLSVVSPEYFKGDTSLYFLNETHKIKGCVPFKS